MKIGKEKKLVGKWKNGKKAGKIMFHWKDGEGLSILSKKLMLGVAHYLIKEGKTGALDQNNEKHRLKEWGPRIRKLRIKLAAKFMSRGPGSPTFDVIVNLLVGIIYDHV